MTADNEMCVVVTQTARVAAADAVKAYRDQRNGNWQQRIRDGKCDDGEMVQAFARFEAEVRIATTADLQARLEAAEGRIAGLVEECAKVAENLDFGPERDERDSARNATCRLIASGIRGLASRP